MAKGANPAATVGRARADGEDGHLASAMPLVTDEAPMGLALFARLNGSARLRSFAKRVGVSAQCRVPPSVPRHPHVIHAAPKTSAATPARTAAAPVQIANWSRAAVVATEAGQSARPRQRNPAQALGHRICISVLAASLLYVHGSAWALGDGTLQIHFMDVGQGDAAILISPNGETVLFDDGVRGMCDQPLSYLRQIGVDSIDYHIASHYHADHIGCAAEVFQAFPLRHDALDRGDSYGTRTFERYVDAVAMHRQTATNHTEIVLDQDSAAPVHINIVALNGDGAQTTNENDLSVVAVVHFEGFAAELGGDLSGFQTGNYQDIETSVAPKVGQIDVYKVHHHGSRYSSNAAWLNTTHPQVAIISTGDGNSYGHPTQECLDRLHEVVRKIYWTETGAGAVPNPTYDSVGGNIVVRVPATGGRFTVACGGGSTDSFVVGAARGHFVVAAAVGGWPQGGTISTATSIYHYYTECRRGKNTDGVDGREGSTPRRARAPK